MGLATDLIAKVREQAHAYYRMGDWRSYHYLCGYADGLKRWFAAPPRQDSASWYMMGHEDAEGDITFGLDLPY